MTDAQDALWGNWLEQNKDLTTEEQVLADMMQTAGWGPPVTRKANGPTKEVWFLRSKSTGLYRKGSASSFSLASLAEARSYRTRGQALNSLRAASNADVSTIYAGPRPKDTRGNMPWNTWRDTAEGQAYYKRVNNWLREGWAKMRDDMEAVCLLVPA